jgi:hypothetical protein
MEDNQHPVLTNLRRQIELLEFEVKSLRSDNDRIKQDYANDVENVRLILLDALSIEQSEDVDVNILANSIADVFALSLLKEITVSISLTAEATLLVPSNFNVDNLSIEDVRMDAFNTEVEDFTVHSFEVDNIEEI